MGRASDARSLGGLRLGIAVDAIKEARDVACNEGPEEDSLQKQDEEVVLDRDGKHKTTFWGMEGMVLLESASAVQVNNTCLKSRLNLGKSKGR